MTAVAYRSVVIEEWLWGTIGAIASVQTTFGSAIYMDNIVPEAGQSLRRLEIVRHPAPLLTAPLNSGGPVYSESFVFDIVGWDAGHTTGSIVAAMEAIHSALMDVDYHQQGDYLISVEIGGELPPAPPPRPGEPPAVRLGREYVTLVGGTG